MFVKNVKKVTVNLPKDLIEFLQEVAEKDKTTFTSALRRAIKAEKFFVDQEKAGHTVLVEDKNKRLREVIRT